MNNIELNAKLSDTNNYEGHVNVVLLDKHKTEVKNINLHNKGCLNLFKFFASALAGDWIKVKDQIPCKVVLFSGDISSQSSESNYWSDEYMASYAVTVDSSIISEKVTDTEGNAIGYKSTLHFRIPFLYLKSNATSITRAALYPSIINDLYDDRLAYFTFTDVISIPDNAINYTLIINWALVIKNAN